MTAREKFEARLIVIVAAGLWLSASLLATSIMDAYYGWTGETWAERVERLKCKNYEQRQKKEACGRNRDA